LEQAIRIAKVLGRDQEAESLDKLRRDTKQAAPLDKDRCASAATQRFVRAKVEQKQAAEALVAAKKHVAELEDKLARATERVSLAEAAAKVANAEAGLQGAAAEAREEEDALPADPDDLDEWPELDRQAYVTSKAAAAKARAAAKDMSDKHKQAILEYQKLKSVCTDKLTKKRKTDPDPPAAKQGPPQAKPGQQSSSSAAPRQEEAQQQLQQEVEKVIKEANEAFRKAQTQEAKAVQRG